MENKYQRLNKLEEELKELEDHKENTVIFTAAGPVAGVFVGGLLGYAFNRPDIGMLVGAGVCYALGLLGWSSANIDIKEKYEEISKVNAEYKK